MTDVRNFWESVLQGYIDSLQQSFDGEMLQYECVLRNIIEATRTEQARRADSLDTGGTEEQRPARRHQ